MLPFVHRVVLPNGLTVMVDERPHLSSVGISVAVRAGSADEAPKQAGLTHLLEHMLFRGSANHPTSDALMAPFEDGGGMLEAETWRDHTHFFAEVHRDASGPAIAALGDMVTRPTWSGLSAEQRLVEAEVLGELDDDGNDHDLHALSRRAIWGDGPMSRRVTGTLAHVRSYTRAALRGHHRECYVGRRMVVALCGPVRADAAVAAVQRAFGEMPAGTPAPPGPVPLFRPDTAISFLPSATSQLFLQLSFEAFGLADARNHEQVLLSAMLSEGMLCRLQRALSDKSGLVYAYEAGLDVYEGGGTYDLEMQVAPARAGRALRTACEVLQGMAKTGPTPREVERAVRRYQLARELARDRPSERSYEMALEALFRRAPALPEPTDLDALRARLAHSAALLFSQRPRHLLAMGPLSEPLRRTLTRSWQAGWPADAERRQASAAMLAAASARPQRVAKRRRVQAAAKKTSFLSGAPRGV